MARAPARDPRDPVRADDPARLLTSEPGRRCRVAAPSCSPADYDGTAEELYLFNGAAALAPRLQRARVRRARAGRARCIERGLEHAARLGEGRHARSWTPAIDRRGRRPRPRRARRAQPGAYLAPRAASAEHRLAACIADCGSFDLYARPLARMPGPLAVRIRPRQAGAARASSADPRGTSAAKPTGGWALRRGMLVHGVDDAWTTSRCSASTPSAGQAGAITCPTWVCNAEGDDISASAPQLVAALSARRYVHFTAAEGAGDHCEAGARALYHERSFGWLDARLGPARVLD